VFDEWLDGQTAKVREIVATRIVRFQSGLFGDVKALGEKVSEMRIAYGPGYRVYYTIRDRVLIVLLCGGEKKTQKKDIKAARELAAEIE
jgi:putative addiction module killer protein